MPKNPRIYPVASFGPEIMAALLRGARERFEVGPMPYRKAVAFHMRVHSLRRSMREENHPEYPLTSRALITVAWGPKAGLPAVPEKFNSRNVPRPADPEAPAKLLIRPHDSDFNDVLLAAGVSADELKRDPLDEISSSITPTQGSTDRDDYLDGILNREPDSKKPPGV